MSNDRAQRQPQEQGQWVNLTELARRERLHKQHEEFKAKLQATVNAGPEHEGYEFANERLRTILQAEESVARHNERDTTGNHAIVDDWLYQYPLRAKRLEEIKPEKLEEETHVTRTHTSGNGGMQR